MSDKGHQQHEGFQLQFVIQSKGFCLSAMMHLHDNQTEDEFCEDIGTALKEMAGGEDARIAYRAWHEAKAKQEIESMTRGEG